MSACAFFTEVETRMNHDLEQYRSQNELKNQNTEEFNKQCLLEALNNITHRIKIKVPDIDRPDLKIDKNNLQMEMEETMILHSNVLDDLFQLRTVKEEMKAIMNSLVQILHHRVKFKNQYKLKTTREVETYIAGDAIFNQINIQIKKVEAQIEKSSELSSLLKSKIGFIRDLTKLKAQELFGESRG